MAREDHKLAAIVFTDVVGYTKQMEENELRTMQLLQKQREIIFPLVESFGGEVIKEIGDGLLMMFGSAVEAVRFAIAVQKRLKDEELTIRAGIHIGDVIFRGGDVFGSAVNTAARIEPLAPPNGICISEDVRSQLQNKTDIVTLPVGKKELKGVKSAVSIYEVFIEGVTLKEKQSLQTFFRDLWNRAVIQIMIGYVASAWIIKLAVASIVGRYMLSPYLVDLTWVILLSLLPAVFLLTYFHSNRKERGWNKIELVGLPVNALLTIILAVFLFQGKDLGAATTTLTVQNEEGQSVTHTILKSEFRKKVALFFFDNQTGNKNLDWLQYGITQILDYDLAQNRLVESQSAFGYVDNFAREGYPTGLKVPLLLMKKIAEYHHKNYFVSGTFDKSDENWSIRIKLYETKNGKLTNDFTETSTDIFALIDKVNLSLKKSLDIPEASIEESTDLPVSEIYTSSIEAFEAFTKSNYEIFFNNNWEEGLAYAEQAVETDNEFAAALVTLSEYYFNNNQPEKAMQALDITVNKLKYKLPEKRLYYAKFFYYLTQQNPDQANAVVKMWTDLYPDDIEARMVLAQRYLMKNNFKGAISQYKYILKIAPDDFEYVKSLGNIYELVGNYDSSIYYYQLYKDNFPQDYTSYSNLGDSYKLQINFEKALENYNNALLIDPENTSIIHKINAIYLKQGRFEEARQLLERAMQNCKTATDSVRIYDGFQSYHEILGEIELAFDYFQKRFDLLENILPPLRIMVFRTFFISIYNEAGKDEEAMNLLTKIETQFQPPFDKVSAFGYLFYYIETGEPEKAKQYISTAKELIEGFGEQTLLPNIYYAEGRIAELQQKYDSAIISYQKYLDLKPGESAIYRWMSRSYRENGNMKMAEEFIQEAIKRHPSSPKTFYEAALYYNEKGDKEKALEYINKANETWKNADDVYTPAQKAKAFQQKLNAAV